MSTVSQKIYNYDYAPGIATYGGQGKTGNDGSNGSTIFFTNTSFINTDEFKILVNQIINNYLPLKNSKTAMARQYQNGDCFFTMDGLIYTLSDLELLKNDGTSGSIAKYIKYFQLVGRITVDTVSYLNYLNKSQRLELNTEYKGFDVITAGTTNVEPYINLNAVMNIISDNVDEYNNINFLQMSAINSYNSINGQMLVYFDTNDNAFHIATNEETPLIINGDVKINQNSISKELDNYSTILTSSDPITVFKTICKNIEYMAVNAKNAQQTSCVTFSIIIKPDTLKYNMMQTKFNNIKDNVFIKIYVNNTIVTYRLKDIDSKNINISTDGTTVYQIELDNDITDSSQVAAVSLLYNTEIFINKYNTTL